MNILFLIAQTSHEQKTFGHDCVLFVFFLVTACLVVFDSYYPTKYQPVQNYFAICDKTFGRFKINIKCILFIYTC